MIQKIQAFEIPGKGTATESKIEVQSRFTTGDKAVIYYDLRDPNGTTPAFDSRIQDYVTLPYAILSRSLIRVTGEDREAVVGDEKQAVVIFKRERADVSVISGIKLALSDNPDEICGMYTNGDVKNYYLDTEDLMSASLLSETEDMKSIVEKEYYVTDGKNIRYWTGKSFDGEYSGICKVKL
jgi:hypothetical protein